jgi:hypothetical protein
MAYDTEQLRLSLSAIRGRLEALGFAELAHLLRLSRRTGRLILVRGPDRVVLLLAQGVVRAISYPTATEELAHLLVSRQIIRESVLQALLARDQATLGLSFAHALQRAAGVDDQRITEVISDLVRQAMSRFSYWTAGCFSFQPLPVATLEAALGQADLCAPELPKLPSAHAVEQLAGTMPDTRIVSTELILRAAGYLATLVGQGLLVIMDGKELRVLGHIKNRRVTTEPSQQITSCLSAWEKHLGTLLSGSSHRSVELPGRLDGKPVIAAPLIVLGRVQTVFCFTSEEPADGASPRLLVARALTSVALSLELHLLQRRHFGAFCLARKDPPLTSTGR